MKKLILIAIAFVTLQAVAQDTKKEHRNGKKEMMKALSAEEMATIMTKKLTLALDLTKEQQVEVQELMLIQATDRKQKIDERAKMKTSKEAKTKSPSAEDINKRLDKKIEAKQKMKSILTDEQYKKWERMQEKREKQEKQKPKMKR
ncbi:hypothetical protein [Psychroserpens sp.]|jgi:hypothetical protein|uniref:hypothetical protein n=1 Tax=Psychroserpens sp. TaxID=2020870 RepID=UPI0039E637CD